MAEVEVPGPESDWGHAAGYLSNGNPALQVSMWEYASRSFRLVAGVSPSLEVLAGRLRLDIERGWEGLGPVDAVMFRVQKIDFALSRLEGNPCPDTYVWVSRAQPDFNVALGTLLHALGIGQDAITFRDNGEGQFVDCGPAPSPDAPSSTRRPENS